MQKIDGFTDPIIRVEILRNLLWDVEVDHPRLVYDISQLDQMKEIGLKQLSLGYFEVFHLIARIVFHISEKIPPDETVKSDFRRFINKLIMKSVLLRPDEKIDMFVECNLTIEKNPSRHAGFLLLTNHRVIFAGKFGQVITPTRVVKISASPISGPILSDDFVYLNYADIRSTKTGKCRLSHGKKDCVKIKYQTKYSISTYSYVAPDSRSSESARLAPAQMVLTSVLDDMAEIDTSDRTERWKRDLFAITGVSEKVGNVELKFHGGVLSKENIKKLVNSIQERVTESSL
ncbi:MAG: hypothetical protein ACXABX_07255, partial [Candidatus Thorarchaeota archaeon]